MTRESSRNVRISPEEAAAFVVSNREPFRRGQTGTPGARPIQVKVQGCRQHANSRRLKMPQATWLAIRHIALAGGYADANERFIRDTSRLADALEGGPLTAKDEKVERLVEDLIDLLREERAGGIEVILERV